MGLNSRLTLKQAFHSILNVILNSTQWRFIAIFVGFDYDLEFVCAKRSLYKTRKYLIKYSTLHQGFGAEVVDKSSVKSAYLSIFSV